MVPGASAAAAAGGILKTKKLLSAVNTSEQNIKKSTTRSRQTVRVNRKKTNTHLKKKYLIKEKKNKNILRIKEKNTLFDYLNKDAKRNK